MLARNTRNSLPVTKRFDDRIFYLQWRFQERNSLGNRGSGVLCDDFFLRKLTSEFGEFDCVTQHTKQCIYDTQRNMNL